LRGRLLRWVLGRARGVGAGVTDSPAFVDFETRSRADLTEVGPRRYAEHPSTRVICAVIKTPEGDIHEVTPPFFGHEGLPRYAAVCAHNAINFDLHIWRMLGWPEPARWIDTAELAKVAGYSPASLEALASDLLGVEKDMAGNALTLSLSKPKLYYGAELAALLELAKGQWKTERAARLALGGGKERLPTARLEAQCVADLDARAFPAAPIAPETVARVVAYCRSDVEIMAELYEVFLKQWLDSDLPGLEQADRALNDRGICFDVSLAKLLLDACEGLAAQALEAAGLGPDQAIEVSPARLKARLAALGVDLPDCQADTLEAALPGAPAEAQALIRARQGVSSIAAGKLRAGLARVCPDGRLRDNRVYMGAHTGRWSGKGMQLDNLARGD
jgi:DNA polymerase